MGFFAVVLAVFVIGLPLVFIAKHGSRKVPETESSAPLFLFLGSVIAVPSAIAAFVLVVGYLLPGWGILHPNRFTHVAVGIPMRGRSLPKHLLRVQDTDMAFLLAVVTAAVAAVGIYMILAAAKRINWRECDLWRYW